MSTANSTNLQSSDLIGQRELRLAKVAKLRELEIDPYPAKTYCTHTIGQIIDAGEDIIGSEVVVAGRVGPIRGHGKILFIDINEDNAKLQLYVKADVLEVKEIAGGRTLKFDELDLVDSFDFIEAYGEITKTQSGELSVQVNYLRMLAKVIRPLPATLEDKEERFRRRYVDMNVNPEVRERMKRRSLFWQAHRDFFNDRGFYEISIPVIEHVPGGGDAVPFTTHMNALKEDFFLRISHELPLKRLIGAGFNKVYDIGARFRNEGLSDEHLPEHVAMEFYWAYADWENGMKLIQELYKYIIEKVYSGQMVFNIREFEVDFSKEWELLDFNSIMQERYGIKDIYTITIEEVKELLTKNEIEFDRSVNIGRGVDALWKRIRKTINGPAFLINHPKYLSPLQKPSLENPLMVERFQPIIAGSELGNGWSEVNDAVDQYDRFLEQQKLRDGGDAEAQWLDIDYVEMLEYGMPPTFGYGHSERVFWFLENVTAREGVPFPLLKMDYDRLSRVIYKDAFAQLESANKDTVADLRDNQKLLALPKLGLASIDAQVSERFPGIKFGYLVLEGVNVTMANKALKQLKVKVETDAKQSFPDKQTLKNTNNISGFRKIYQASGVDPDGRMNSAEALISRVLSGKGIYNINNVVDTYNATSVELSLPMAAYDLDQVVGNLQLRFAAEGETIQKIGETEPTVIKAGELVYSDSEGVTCVDFNYRDADRTKVTGQTNRIIVFVDGHQDVSNQQIEAALAILQDRLSEHTGAKATGFNIVVANDVSLANTYIANHHLSSFPSLDDTRKLLRESVSDEYQRHHAEMVSKAMREYASIMAEKYPELSDSEAFDPERWAVCGLVHDWDYQFDPEGHPERNVDRLRAKGYPEDIILAILGHKLELNTSRISKMAQALLAIDEMSGLLFAYSKMKGGYNDMEVKGVLKKFKDKGFAAKLNRADIELGIQELGITLEEHIQNLISTFQH